MFHVNNGIIDGQIVAYRIVNVSNCLVSNCPHRNVAYRTVDILNPWYFDLTYNNIIHLIIPWLLNVF